MPDKQASLGFGTRAIRAATRLPRVEQEPDAVPIYQAVTFSASDAEELGDILRGRRPGYAYSRVDNPTAAAMAAAVADIEGAEAGYAFATGMAAVHAALVSVLSAADHVVATSAAYGNTYNLIARVLSRFGVDATFVQTTDQAAVERALTDRTRVLYLETIANPTLTVADQPALVELAHRNDISVVVDNTFASPYVCRPVELGADLVIEAATKWLGGHSDVQAGVVVGGSARIARVRDVQIDTGASAAPLSAFLVLRGLETLHVRMERHSASALALARALEAHRLVKQLWYPTLSSHPQFDVAQRVLRTGGGLLAFDLGSRQRAAAFLDALQIPPRTASLGSVRTIAVHPPSSTHRQLNEAELAAAGILPGLVRVSVGLEDVDDLLADFEQALTAASSLESHVSA